MEAELWRVEDFHDTICCQDGSGLYRSQGKVQVYATQQAANKAAGDVFAQLLDQFPLKEPGSDEDYDIYSMGPVYKPAGYSRYRSGSIDHLSQYRSLTADGRSIWSCSKDYTLGWKDAGSSKLTVQVQEAELVS